MKQAPHGNTYNKKGAGPCSPQKFVQVEAEANVRHRHSEFDESHRYFLLLWSFTGNFPVCVAVAQQGNAGEKQEGVDRKNN